MEDLVSIIMPICNEIKYLRYALESILNQSYRNWELIVVDSSDSRKIVKKLLPDDKRIRYFYRIKNGISDALNFGIEKARGKYIARMDADDISAFDRLEKQVCYLKVYKEVDILGTYFTKINVDGIAYEERRPPKNHDAICMNLIFENPICHPSVMFRKKVFEKSNKYSMVVAEDYELWTRLVFSYRFAILPDSLLKWRRHENSSSLSNDEYVNVSDIISTKKYVAQMFGIDSEYYYNETFIKNYRREKLRLWFHFKKTDAVVEQILLLAEMRRKCIKSQLIYIREEVNKRWLLCLELIGCYTYEMKRIYDISEKTYDQHEDLFENINKEMHIDIMSFPKKMHNIINENFIKGEKIRQEEIKFILYGLGSNGIHALERYLQQKEKGIEKWLLSGLIDRKAGNIVCHKKQFTVYEKKQIKKIEYDMILISSSKYFEEIKRELLKMGIPEEKLMGDAILWY